MAGSTMDALKTGAGLSLLLCLGVVVYGTLNASAGAPAVTSVTGRSPQADADGGRSAAEAAAEVRWTFARRSLDAFRQSLLDPSSAQIRDAWQVDFGPVGAVGTAVCGVVNAKNEFGAYTGERPFIAMGTTFWTPDHPNFARHFQDICLAGRKVNKMR